jgi:hypothetical protein
MYAGPVSMQTFDHATDSNECTPGIHAATGVRKKISDRRDSGKRGWGDRLDRFAFGVIRLRHPRRLDLAVGRGYTSIILVRFSGRLLGRRAGLG